jgi:hypothetical protein
LFRVGVTWRMDGVGLDPKGDFDVQVLLEMRRESMCDVRRCCRLRFVVTFYIRGTRGCTPSNGSNCPSRTLLSPCRRPTFPGIGCNVPERDPVFHCRHWMCSVLLVQQLLRSLLVGLFWFLLPHGRTIGCCSGSNRLYYLFADLNQVQAKVPWDYDLVRRKEIGSDNEDQVDTSNEVTWYPIPLILHCYMLIGLDYSLQ